MFLSAICRFTVHISSNFHHTQDLIHLRKIIVIVITTTTPTTATTTTTIIKNKKYV